MDAFKTFKDDPRFSAYLLGELNAIEQKAFEDWLEKNADAKKYLNDLKTTVLQLKHGLKDQAHVGLAAEQREALREKFESRKISFFMAMPIFQLSTLAIVVVAIFFVTQTQFRQKMSPSIAPSADQGIAANVQRQEQQKGQEVAALDSKSLEPKAAPLSGSLGASASGAPSAQATNKFQGKPSELLQAADAELNRPPEKPLVVARESMRAAKKELAEGSTEGVSGDALSNSVALGGAGSGGGGNRGGAKGDKASFEATRVAKGLGSSTQLTDAQLKKARSTNEGLLTQAKAKGSAEVHDVNLAKAIHFLSGGSAFEKPTFRVTRNVGTSTLALSGDRTIRSECLAFSDFALIIERDPGLKGDHFRTRTNPQKLTAAALCAESFNGQTLEWQEQEYWLLGVIGNWAVLQDEGNGSVNHFMIVDKVSGKKVFQDSYNQDAGLKLLLNKGVLSASYFRSLEVPCNPYLKERECVAQVRKQNQIPESVRWNQADCSVVAKQHPDDAKAGGLSLSALVVIDDISKTSTKRFLNDSASTPALICGDIP